MKERINRRLYNTIKAYVRENRILYTLARGVKDGPSEEHYVLLRGYYDYRADVTTIIIHHFGELNQGRIIYYCADGDDEIATSGFCALLRRNLFRIGFADEMGMIPVIKWGKHTHYYDQGMDKTTDNAFEYYFQPVSDVPYQDAIKSRNVVCPMRTERSFIMKKYNVPITNQYQPAEEEIAMLGNLYRKYLHLNEETKSYLKKEISRSIGAARVLGVHVRGTDFKMGFRGHPIPVNPQEHLEKAKELLAKGEYDQIFLATDDLGALELFKSALPSTRLVYYDDVLRAEGRIGSHNMESARPFHHYKLGLEVLRDVYTLALCDGLIAGLSQVSFAARYVNYALERRYRDLVILDHGINDAGEIAPATEKLK